MTSALLGNALPGALLCKTGSAQHEGYAVQGRAGPQDQTSPTRLNPRNRGPNRQRVDVLGALIGQHGLQICGLPT